MKKITELKYTVEELSTPILLREYLATLSLSKTLIKKVKYSGLFVDGERVTVRRVLHGGERLTLVLPEESSEGILPIDIPLSIVYEDDDVLIVDKPTNMPTHPSRGNSLPTLANAVMAKYGGGFVFRAITRLDRDTSGLVLIAKNAVSAQRLSESMKSGKITKRYKCIVSGIPNPKKATVNAPIRRRADGDMVRIVAEDGKSAITEYEVKEIIGENALCEVNLLTGRTHQIRVHMAHIGHALVGDFLYGTRSEDGYFLRCFHLNFPHPKTNENINIEI